MPLDVLIVDDSATMRRIVKRALSLSGLPIGHIREAENGRQALDLIGGARFGLALLDLNMPVMDGLEALEHIRRAPDSADLPIVVVTTEGSEQRVARVRELAAGFVRKPFTPERLLEAIVVALGGRGHVAREQ